MPDEALSYTVTFRNDSNQPSCGNDIGVTLSDWVDYISDSSTDITLDDGKVFEDPFGNPLSSISVGKLGPVTDTYGNDVYTYRLGGSLEAQRDLVCMPPHSV